MAQQNHFSITITRVESILFQGDILSVTLPGSEGQLTVLAHHEPLIALLKTGLVEIVHTDGTTRNTYEIEKGILEVSNNQVTILV